MNPAERSHRARLVLCFAAVYLIWGSTYAVASVGVHELPPILFGGVRFICAGVLLGIAALALGRRFPLDATEWRHLLIVAAGSVLIPNGFTNWAMQTVASNQTAILNVSAALWIALLATRGRRAHALDARTVTGLVIGYAGAVLIVWPRGSFVATHFGMQILILAGVFVWSAATVYIRNVHSKLDLLAFSSLQMLLGGVMMTAAGLAMGEASAWHRSTRGVTAMAYLTIASSCIAYTAFSWLARNTTPALAGTYSYVNPAIAALLGWWFLGETLGAKQIVGMAVMFAGVALVSWPQPAGAAAVDARAAHRDEDRRKDPTAG
jgi:drug/metabolite transporter (DMT)-like permease